ncbi:MAG: hypothetical protein PHY48_16460 [Candidatus Cloacimonetes bacterium]|nr:hypothetical protein [Candidatus Cloacimonadota bacterium]
MPKKVLQKSIPLSLITLLFIISLLMMCSSTYGQDVNNGPVKTDKPWGIGTSITYPMADIYMVQGSYSASKSGDILFGVAYQNWKNDQGRARAYTLLLGYRQYIWKGLHTELELWPAYNPFYSFVDGQTYAGAELWMSLRVGYRQDFNLANNDFFILAQPSIGFGVARDNPWPEKEKDDKAIFEPQVLLGIRL